MKGLAQYQRSIEKDLRTFFEQKRRELAARVPHLLPLLKPAQAFVLDPKAKRLRGFLLTQGYALIAGKVPRAIQRLSRIPELVHASLLIHDDLIDRDEERRGNPTVHIRLQHSAPHNLEAEHYGFSQAILLGNLLGIWAQEELLASNMPAQRKHAALRKLNSMLEETHFGQMLELELTGKDQVTEDEILTVYHLKTAMYTFEAPLHLGALLAGASARALALITRFAVPLGIAFQLQDDLLGIYGGKAKQGKAFASDIAEGKKLFILQYAHQHGTAVQRRKLVKLQRKGLLAAGELKQLQDVLEETGALLATQRYAAELVQKAKRVLQDARLHAPAVKELLDLADFTIERTR